MLKSTLTSLALNQTIGYFAGLVVLGLFSSALGPTLPGLAANVGAPLALISLLFTTRSFGYLVGSLSGGRIYDRLPGHPVLVTVLVGMAVFYFVVPLVPWLIVLAGVMFLIGMGEATLDVGSNTLLMWVHRAGVGPYMNALHFFFGVGALVGPIIIAQVMLRTGGITTSYWILGVCALPVALWLARLPSPTRQHEAQAVEGETGPGMLIGLIVLFFFLYVGAEVSFAGWIYTYTFTLGLANAATAAYLTALFWGAFMVGRLAGIPIAAWVRARIILLFDLLGCLVSLAVILLWPRSFPAIVVGTAGLGLSMASLFPTTLVWAQRRMTITGRVAGYFFMGAGAGGMVLPWVIGQLFESLSPYVTMWIILIDVVAAFAVFFVLMAYSNSLKRQSSAV